MKYLRIIFQIFKINNISVNLKKTFFEYSFVTLLNQHVIFLKFFIDEFKLRTILNFKFFSILSQLKKYLELIE